MYAELVPKLWSETIEGHRRATSSRHSSAEELASYCLHAITAAADLPSKASVRRLVRVILAGLRPDPA